jgi:hypothetical protein
MNYADYFYLTAYPEYSGYRIEHDPTITAYCHLTTSQELPEDNGGDTAPNMGGALLVIIFIIMAIIAVAVLVTRKRS